MKNYLKTGMALIAAVIVLTLASSALKAETISELSVLAIDNHSRAIIANNLSAMNGVIDVYVDDAHSRIYIMYDPTVLIPYNINERVRAFDEDARLSVKTNSETISGSAFIIETPDVSKDMISRILKENNGIVDNLISDNNEAVAVLYLKNAEDAKKIIFSFAYYGVYLKEATGMQSMASVMLSQLEQKLIANK